MKRNPTLALALLTLAALATDLKALDERVVRHTFPLAEGETLRLANLAGSVRLVPGSRGEVEVAATLHAEGRDAAETRELLQGMEWVEARDRKGLEEWVLSYPVRKYRGFAYPRSASREGDAGFFERLLGSLDLGSRSTTTYRGERISVYERPAGSVPILYADLEISMPARGKLRVRNLVGRVEGGELEGDLVVDTGSGEVELAGFSGKLNVDTGSGRVRLGRVRGETLVDTGSGSIEVGELVGNGDLDTGSGSITVRKVAAGKLRADTGSGSITVEDGTVSELLTDTGSGSITVRGVEVERFVGDTGSGGVTLESSLAQARDVRIDTGSGSVKILAGADASFDLEATQGSGDLICRYSDAILRKRGHKVVGAERGDRQTRIRVDTGSGDCVIAPKRG